MCVHYFICHSVTILNVPFQYLYFYGNIILHYGGHLNTGFPSNSYYFSLKTTLVDNECTLNTQHIRMSRFLKFTLPVNRVFINC